MRIIGVACMALSMCLSAVAAICEPITPPSYRELVFNANGGNCPTLTKTVVYGEPVGTLPTATKSGCLFDGWYTAASGGTKVTSETLMSVDYNVTLFAHWKDASQLLSEVRDGVGAIGCRLAFAGDAPWQGVVAAASFCEHYYAQSGQIGDGGSSTLEMTFIGSGDLRFSWDVSSERGYDKLTFAVDGVERLSISGEPGWSNVVWHVAGSGTHVVRWTYQKDGSDSEGEDCGRLGTVSWTGPKITYPVTFNANGGQVSESRIECPIGAWYESYYPDVWREGYGFLGWYSAPQGGVNAIDYRVLEQPLTLYAHWQYVTPGSCVSAATRLYMGSGVKTESVTLVPWWGDDGWGYPNYDYEYGVRYYRMTLQRGQIYTLALPLGGWFFDVYEGNWEETVDVSWADDGNLEYALVNTAQMDAAQKDVIICIGDGAVGDRTTLYYAPGDLVPVGLRGKPEPVSGALNGDEYRVSAERTLRNGEYWFSITAVPGVKYEFSVAGRSGLGLSLQDGTRKGEGCSVGSSQLPCDVHEDQYKSSRIVFHVSEAQTVYICVSASEAGAFTASAHWSRMDYDSCMADLRREVFEGQGFGLSTDEDLPWTVADGAARTTKIGNGESTSLEMTVYGRGWLSFDWKTSSESGYDALDVEIDGVSSSGISGERSWEYFSKYLYADGPHVIRWTYRKDGSASSGEDCGWIRNVVWSRDCSSAVVDGCTYYYTLTGKDEALLLDVEVPSYKSSFVIPAAVNGHAMCGVADDFFNGGSKNVTSASLHVHYSGTFYVGARALANSSVANATCPHGQSFICQDVLQNSPGLWVCDGLAGFGTAGVSRWATGLVSNKLVSFVSSDFQGISPHAFENSGLGKVVIASSVTKIGVSAFAGCEGPFVFQGEPPAVYDEDGLEINPDCEAYPVGAFGPYDESDNRYVIFASDAPGWTDGGRWCGLRTCRAQTVNVRLDANGGNVSPSQVALSTAGTYSALPSAHRPGYGFAGWYTMRNGGTRVDPTDAVDESVTLLFAHWQMIEPGSSPDVAAPISMTTSVQTKAPVLVRAWEEGRGASEDRGAYCYSVELTRGRIYTVAVPRGAEIVILPENESVAVDFGGDATLDYYRLDTRGMSTLKTQVSISLGGAIGQTVVFRHVEGDYLPVGAEANPEILQSCGATGALTAGGTRTLRRDEWGYGLYWFGAALQTGVRYRLTAKGFPGIDVETINLDWSYDRTDDSVTVSFEVASDTYGYFYVYADELEEFSYSWSAVRTDLSFRLLFNANGGYCPTASKTVPYMDPVGSLPKPERSGSVFLGWYTARDGGAKVVPTTPMSVMYDITLYAHWITLTPGSSEISAVPFVMTSAVQNRAVTLTAEWAEDDLVYESCGTYYMTTTLARGRFYTVAVPCGMDVQVWSENGETGIERRETPSLVYYRFDTRNMSAASTRAYVVFWGNIGQRSTLHFVEGDYMPSNVFRLLFDANGGSCPDPTKDVRYMEPVGDLPVPVRQDGTFLGWYTAQEGGTRVTASTLMSVYYDIRLYAHWEMPTPGSASTVPVAISLIDRTVRQSGFGLVREFSDGQYRDEGVFYARISLKAGHQYTFALPKDSGIEFSVWGPSACFDDGHGSPICTAGPAGLHYAEDDTLVYCMVEPPSDSDYSICFRGPIGLRSTFYWTEGNLLPKGCEAAPETLPGGIPPTGYDSVSGSRKPLAGEYWFETTLVPGVSYSLEAFGDGLLAIEAEDESAVEYSYSDPRAGDAYIELRTDVPKTVKLCVSSESGESFTAYWTRYRDLAK